MKYMTLKYDRVWFHENKRADQYYFGETMTWIPDSLIRDMDPNKHEIEIPAWYVWKKGLEGYAID